VQTKNLRKSLLIGAVALGVTGIAAWANHVSTPLSYIAGPNVLSRVSYFEETGIPPLAIGNGEFEEGEVLSFAPGDSFVIRSNGHEETITFQAADFADFDSVTPEEALARIDAKSALAAASLDNFHSLFSGLQGGDESLLELIDGSGSPLLELKQSGGLYSGSRNIRMDISIPSDHHGDGDAEHGGLENHPYLLLASTTDGSFLLRGEQVPIGLDATTARFLFWSRFPNALPGFMGRLDDNEDSEALLRRNVMSFLLRNSPREELYFAFVVFSMDLRDVEFVSNRFTVDFESAPSTMRAERR
jgi:hypothetical protein